MLNSFLIHRDPLAMDTSRQILDSFSTDNSCILKLNTSRSIELYDFSIYRVPQDFSSFLLNLFWLFCLLISQTSLLHSNPPTQVLFSLREHFLLLVCLFFILSSCILRSWPNFLVFVENLGFFKIVGFFTKIFGLVFVKMFLNHHVLHHICILTIFSCILDVWLLC